MVKMDMMTLLLCYCNAIQKIGYKISPIEIFKTLGFSDYQLVYEEPDITLAWGAMDHKRYRFVVRFDREQNETYLHIEKIRVNL